MSDLVRFGVAMERALLQQFDDRIAAKGYENRSEALRDLVRQDLVQAAWDGGSSVAGTLTVVFDPRARDAALRLSETGTEPSTGVLATLRVPIDESRALEVFAVRGRASDLTALAGRLGGSKGVLACQLTLALASAETPRPLPFSGTP